ncbi:MAG: DUF4430 domain-containing protein [Clostridiales bacterium]|nr:DUF4430 domain-containing protein [Clostridiales bacterium]
MKRIRNFLVFCLLFVLCTVGFTSCKKGGVATATILSKTDTQVVIQVNQTDGNAVLLNVMEDLQKKGELTFVVESGMVTSINGVANDADFDPCWMIYTSDSEMASTAWGSVEYNGQTFGSAVVGAEALTVIQGGIYIWVYQGF